MSDIDKHCKTLLGAIVPNRKDLLEIAVQQIIPEFFQDPYLKNIYIIIERYYERDGGVLTKAMLIDTMAKRVDAGKLALYDEIFGALEEATPTDEEFRWAMNEIKDLAAERATGETLMQGVEIFRTGIRDDKGNEVKGHAEARFFLIEKFSEIDRDLTKQSSPEGDMRDEGAEMVSEYLTRKNDRLAGKIQGVRFGIDSIDQVCGGLQNADLCLVAGFSSTGKTAAMVQLAWSCAVEQGQDFVFLTSETVRPQVRRRILSRHSKHPMFEIPNGLNSRDIKNGTLTPDEEKQFAAVVRDFTTNQNYGKAHIIQIPQGATMAHCYSRLIRLQRQFDIKLVIIDYLRLLKTERGRQSDREELNSIVIEAKDLARTFADGRGVPVVSPWQTSRSSYESALKAGFYNSSSLSETQEAFNSSDLVITYLAQDGPKDRHCQLRGQVLKARDDETAAGLLINVDYGTSCFSTQRQADLSGFGDSGSLEDQFAGLI